MPSARSKYLQKRFIQKGADGLMPWDALELLLSYCADDEHLRTLMNSLSDRYRSVTDILNASPDELRKIDGMPNNVIALFEIMPQLYSIYTALKIPAERLDDAENSKRYFSDLFRGLSVEQFRLVCLSDDFSVVRCELLNEGNAGQVDVDLTDITRLIIKTRCRLVMIGHNHPGGSCLPSQSDILSTEYLQKRLRDIGVVLVDHIVCGADGVTSVMRSGEYPICYDPEEAKRVLEAPNAGRFK